jgi:hypothetical protein
MGKDSTLWFHLHKGRAKSRRWNCTHRFHAFFCHVRRSLIVALFLLATTVVGRAESSLTVEQLPAPVQKALHERRGDQPIKRILLREIRGKVVYDIELDIPRALNRYVRIAGNGEVLADTRSSTTGARPTAPPRH